MAEATPWIPVAITVTGGYLAWFGVHYWRSAVKWPSDPVKAVLTGKGIPDNTKTIPQAAAPGNQPVQGGTLTPNQLNHPQLGAYQTVPSTGVLSKDQLQALWTSNGGDPSTADVAAAVALAESSGRPGVTSPNPDGGTNVGLWQLDTRGVGSGYSIAQLSDPATNARVAILGSGNGTRWGAWQTYVEGTYRNYL